MNIHKVLLVQSSLNQTLRPIRCRIWRLNTSRQTFSRCLPRCPAFGMQRASWTRWKLFPDIQSRTAIMECVEECEGEYIAITRDRVEEWTQLVRERAALTQFQSLALQAGSNLTTFADLPDLYSQMGEALT